MKKRYLLFLVLSGCGLFNRGLREKDYVEIAPVYCECVQNKVGDLSPHLIQSLEIAVNDPSFDVDDHLDSLMTTMTDKEIKYFETTIEKLENLFDEEDVFEDCYVSLADRWPRTEKVDIYEFETKIQDYLSEDCSTTRLFLEAHDD